MRATIGDVLRPGPRFTRRETVEAWWFELPMRRSCWWRELFLLPMRRSCWWRELFLAEGEGWFRWAWGERVGYENLGEGLYNPEYRRVGPPLRRAWEQVCWAFNVPRLMLREHLSWEEVRPDLTWLRADSERREELWR